MVRHHTKFTVHGILLALFTKDSFVFSDYDFSTATATAYWLFPLPVLWPRGFLGSDFHCFIKINRQKTR